MAPILGIYASQISGHLFQPSGAYDSIATVTVGTATSSITFSSIPQTYTHLQLRAFIQPATGKDLTMRMNGDTTGANYYTHYINGYGTGVSSSGGGTYYGGAVGLGYNDAALANVYGAHIIDILDYTNTSKNTTTRTLFGSDYNGSGQVAFLSGLWINTAAVNSLTFVNLAGGNFTTNSQIALYGIKGN